MPTFYDRLLEEKTQLEERRQKLNVFLLSDKTDSIDSVQLLLLNIQAQVMLTYSQILSERITLITKTESSGFEEED